MTKFSVFLKGIEWAIFSADFSTASQRAFKRQILRSHRARVSATEGSTSFAGEADAISKVLARLGIASGFCVDIAASDGVTQSSTLTLFDSPKWNGLAIEMDPEKFAVLASVYSQLPNARLARQRVVPSNVVSLLEGFEVPRDFDFMNLDIDSYDLFVIEAMLDAEFSPKVLSMEINEKIPPPVYFTVVYVDDHYWTGDHFFGCSLTAAVEVLKSHGYLLVELEFNNALFVRAEICAGKFEDLEADEAYDMGYRNRLDRVALFPWNSDVEEALTLSPMQTVAFFEELFAEYQGKYILECR